MHMHTDVIPINDVSTQGDSYTPPEFGQYDWPSERILAYRCLCATHTMVVLKQ